MVGGRRHGAARNARFATEQSNARGDLLTLFYRTFNGIQCTNVKDELSNGSFPVVY